MVNVKFLARSLLISGFLMGISTANAMDDFFDRDDTDVFRTPLGVIETTAHTEFARDEYIKEETARLYPTTLQKWAEKGKQWTEEKNRGGLLKGLNAEAYLIELRESSGDPSYKISSSVAIEGRFLGDHASISSKGKQFYFTYAMYGSSERRWVWTATEIKASKPTEYLSPDFSSGSLQGSTLALGCTAKKYYMPGTGLCTFTLEGSLPPFDQEFLAQSFEGAPMYGSLTFSSSSLESFAPSSEEGFFVIVERMPKKK
jgi:hypothetical protein